MVLLSPGSGPKDGFAEMLKYCNLQISSAGFLENPLGTYLL